VGNENIIFSTQGTVFQLFITKAKNDKASLDTRSGLAYTNLFTAYFQLCCLRRPCKAAGDIWRFNYPPTQKQTIPQKVKRSEKHLSRCIKQQLF
jgi:hypothetical protein